MNIIVSTDPTAVTLDDADEFTSFAVTAGERSRDDLDTLLGTLGTFDGDHAWIDVEALAELAGRKGSDPDWRAGLAAMVDYARGAGFLSEDGTAVRAHVEWTG